MSQLTIDSVRVLVGNAYVIGGDGALALESCWCLSCSSIASHPQKRLETSGARLVGECLASIPRLNRDENNRGQEHDY